MEHFELLLKHIREFEDARSEEMEVSGDNGWDINYYPAFLTADVRFRKAATLLNLDYPDALPEGNEREQMAEVNTRFISKVVEWKTRLLAQQIEARVALEYEDITQELSEAIVFDTEHKTGIHQVISDLRSVVYASDWLGDERKQRVLRAVNSVQAEVDKELSNFHLLLGKIVDLGDALGTAGKKAKPAFDRIEQLSSIIRGQRKQTTAIEKDPDPLQIEDQREG
ncbi:hypothetical protein [Tritonibacter mobilis]|uniref:hypothetical protein n=1 Tax=Tritonibacter mobilis TaxID=379347 RepID=UPI000806E222|nr:hypothetical protein [Tritonibacter mobilis]GLP85346.1 hypothetical protein GCM10007921_09060 [Tritonibacter mobilis]SDW75780.1 hypothetical protein SAMN05444385_103291 [Tritonibacter mobilis]